MAAAKKGKKTSKPKKGSKGKKKGGNSSFFTKFILILLMLSLVAAAIFLTLKDVNLKEIKTRNINDNEKTEVVVKKDENKKEIKQEEKAKNKTTAASPKKEVSPKTETKKAEPKKTETEPKKESKTLEGCWLSSEQGASLTFDEYGYRIDFFNVNASKPITGDYHFENNLIIFSSDGDVCKGVEGKYRITFYKNNFSLICKDDDCTNRRNILEADWEEIEL